MAIDLSKYKKATTTQATGSPKVDLSKYKKVQTPKANLPVGQLFGSTFIPSREQSEDFVGDVKETGSSIMNTIRRTGSKLKDTITAGAEGKQGVLETGLQTAGFLTGGAFGLATDVGIGLGKLALPQGAEDYIGQKFQKGAEKVISLSPVQAGIEAYKGASPRTQRNIEAVFEVATALPLPPLYRAGKAVGPKVADAVVDTTRKVSDKAKSTAVKAFEPTTAKLESKVVEQFQKGVKPRINMNMTPSQATKFQGDIVEAARVIDRNKPNLKFVDDIGDEIVGRNPQTLAELSDALEQTKKQVFKDYDTLAQQAGKQGLKINTNNIAKELDTVISNEALQITNPQAIRYAMELKDRLSFRELDAKTVQDVIQNYNESLKAFYRNPTYDSASKASIDAMIANQMRQQLDEGITGLTGQQYQAIKNQYASLKAVEKDIIKAALRDARKNNKSLLDYTDILTGGDIITGLITFNPTALARGGVSRGIKEFYKYLNSPNRAVKKMFESAEKLNQRSIPKSQAIPSPSASVIPSGTSRLSTQPSANIPMTPKTNVIPSQSNTLPKKSSGLINTIKKKINETPNKQGGFIKLPQGKGEQSVSQAKSSLPKNNTDLIKEAKKYKSAEEFVNKVDNATEGIGSVGKIADSFSYEKVNTTPKGNTTLANIPLGNDSKYFDMADGFADKVKALKDSEGNIFVYLKEGTNPEKLSKKTRAFMVNNNEPWNVGQPKKYITTDNGKTWQEVAAFELGSATLGMSKSQLEQIWKEANKK